MSFTLPGGGTSRTLDNVVWSRSPGGGAGNEVCRLRLRLVSNTGSSEAYVVSYVLQDSVAEKAAADRLPAEWDEVILKSKNVDASLRIVKRKFTQANKYSRHVRD